MLSLTAMRTCGTSLFRGDTDRVVGGGELELEITCFCKHLYFSKFLCRKCGNELTKPLGMNGVREYGISHNSYQKKKYHHRIYRI